MAFDERQGVPQAASMPIDGLLPSAGGRRNL